ncbi:MAG: DUF167 domain-containing protein [Alphaproteobacteria bacterium]|nr:DUF167 domain-containing protein [Alphaproteobacteria bacterium]
MLSSSDYPPFWEETKDGVKVYIRLTPKSSGTGISGFYEDSAGKSWLKVTVNAPPTDGKANQALLSFLAKKGRFPKTSLSLIGGISDRYKTILINGNTADIRCSLWQMLS